MTTLQKTITGIITEDKAINHWKEIKGKQSECFSDDFYKLSIAIEVIESYENLIDHILNDFVDVTNIETTNPV